jgi:hypothetical protein
MKNKSLKYSPLDTQQYKTQVLAKHKIYQSLPKLKIYQIGYLRV